MQECSMRNTASHTLAPSGDEGRHLYEWALTRFLDETKVLIRLNHPCIVQVLTVFKALGTAYYVMPLVKGTELHRATPAPGNINEVWLRPVLEQLLGALGYLHGQGLLHRDIKPSNILLRPDGSPLLIDFGTAREKIPPTPSPMWVRRATVRLNSSPPTAKTARGQTSTRWGLPVTALSPVKCRRMPSRAWRKMTSARWPAVQS